MQRTLALRGNLADLNHCYITTKMFFITATVDMVSSVYIVNTFF